MMNSTKALFSNFILFGLLCLNNVTAQLENDQDISKRGTTAAQFLKIGAGGRATAMGGANVALSADLSSSYWNPAGLGRINNIQVYFENNEWLANTNYNFGAVGFSVPKVGVFCISPIID